MTNADRQTKAQRQNAAREKARLMREEAKKKARRNKILLQSGIGIAVIAVLAVIAIVVVNLARPTSTAGPKNMISDGILLTSTTSYVSTPGIPNGGKPTPTTQPADGKAHITIYEDLQCPYCNQFETANDAQLSQWLNAGTATLEIHPISFLDRSSNGNRYSSRAASALGCVAQYDPKDFFAVNKALYAAQPAEGSNGKTDAQILATLKQGGASSSAITDCVHQERFKGWVQQTYKRTIGGAAPIPNSSLKSISGTPTVLVNGQQFDSGNNVDLTDASAFLAFVKASVSGWSPTKAG
ncbi:MAG: DsbA family protein [Microbacteriaceae bacterium]|nr:DsbA family protein [Microbacteriaceae bacterium]MCL2795476.1 DsbA family protein [Microbacteriaceae bacterium]